MDQIEKLLASMGLSKDRIEAVRSNKVPLGPKPEKAYAKGRLTITGISDDKTWKIYEDNNTITDKGFEILARVWSGQFGASNYDDNYRPARIAIGLGQHTTSINTRTALNTYPSPVIIADPTGVDFNATTTSLVGSNGCKIEWIVEKDEANAAGAPFTEAGLFPIEVEGSETGAGGMIAYKAFPDITKTADFALLFSWEFTFTLTP